MVKNGKLGNIADGKLTGKSKELSAQQHEDAALKSAISFFADELLPYLGIQGKVIGYAPTEVVHLEVKRLLQDFNLIMSDGSWKHFEFQSKNEGIEGLRRYRSYEALTSYQYKVPVTTYVLFSGSIRNPMTELKEGENTYRIIPIIMQNKNADGVLDGLKRKMEAGKVLTREDLVPLSLCLLMGGTLSHKERVKTAFDITRNTEGVSTEDLAKIEAIVFVMADKFLNQAEMEEIKEEIRMTNLLQRLLEEEKEKMIEEVRERVREEEKEKVIEEVRERVREEEACMYSSLINYLVNEGKENMIIKIANDTKLRKQLYKKYQL